MTQSNTEASLLYEKSSKGCCMVMVSVYGAFVASIGNVPAGKRIRVS